MASSINYAQDVKKIPCNLCKVSDDALWFCKQCIKNLCDNCKEVHSNIPQCDSHTVVSVIEGLKVDTNVNITCTTHKNPLDFFCRTCDLKICAGCLTETHRQHDFCLLIDHVKHLEGILEERHNKKERDLQMVQQKIQSLEEHITRYKEEMKACGRELQTCAAQKINTIKEMERGLQQILDRKEKENVSKMENHLQDLKKVESEHEKLLQTLNEHRSNNVPSTFIDFMKDSNKLIQSLDVDMTLELPSAEQFVRNETNTLNPGSFRNVTSIQIIIKTKPKNETIGGAVSPAKSGGNLSDPALKKILHVVGNISDGNFGSGVVSINVVDEHKVWIGVVLSNSVLLMNKKKIERTVDLPNSPSYTALLNSGDLLVSCGTKIKHVTLKGGKKDFADLSCICEKVLSIAAIKQNEIFACLQVKDGIKKVVKLSSEGRKLVDVDTSMLASDRCSDILDANDGTFVIRDQKQIVFFDHMGNIVRSLKCSGSLGQVYKIAFDNYKRILGFKGDELLVFSSDGTLLCTYDITPYKSIYSTYSLVVDRYNNLWLGLYRKVVIVTYL